MECTVEWCDLTLGNLKICDAMWVVRSNRGSTPIVDLATGDKWITCPDDSDLNEPIDIDYLSPHHDARSRVCLCWLHSTLVPSGITGQVVPHTVYIRAIEQSCGLREPAHPSCRCGLWAGRFLCRSKAIEQAC
jgi:hypothetical protein